MTPARRLPTPLPSLHFRGLGRPVPMGQILRFEAADNYTRIWVQGQVRPLLYGYTLRVMCQRFPFMARVAKSTAINPQHVQLTPNPRLILCDQQPLWLSRHYQKRAFAELQRARQVAGL